jgi:hypothetical protein
VPLKRHLLLLRHRTKERKRKPKETHPFDITTQGWQKFIEEHKALFTKMYDIRIHKILSHLRLLTAFIKDGY